MRSMGEDETTAPAENGADGHGDKDADGHGDKHGDGHGDGHGHDGETLGPIDVPAWGASLLGFAVAALTAAAFAISTGYL
jgi:hypothetical protein